MMLFYEFFYFVFGNDNLYLNIGYEIYEFIRMSKMFVVNVLRNLEIFVVMVVVYYYMVNKLVVDGNRVEFYVFFVICV